MLIHIGASSPYQQWIGTAQFSTVAIQGLCSRAHLMSFWDHKNIPTNEQIANAACLDVLNNAGEVRTGLSVVAPVFVL